MRLEVRIARNWSDQTSAFYAAKGGLERAISTLRDDETDHDSLDDDWAEEIADELNNCIYSTNVIDESAKINVNTADEETLTKTIAYCMTSAGEEQIQEEMDAQAQTLATAIIEKRPYRTVAGVAKANDMTPEILYGESDATSDVEETSTEEEEATSVALVDITTAYSVDKNTTPDGTNRVNISSADANQIREGVNPEGEEITLSLDNEKLCQQITFNVSKQIFKDANHPAIIMALNGIGSFIPNLRIKYIPPDRRPDGMPIEYITDLMRIVKHIFLNFLI